jgi:uncharacterized repeat protein (TIGR03803 family)
MTQTAIESRNVVWRIMVVAAGLMLDTSQGGSVRRYSIGPILVIAIGICCGVKAPWASCQTYQYSTIYNFTGGADGNQIGDLCEDPSGNLYADSVGTYDSTIYNNSPVPGNGAIVKLAVGTHAPSIVVSLPAGATLPAIPEGPYYFDSNHDLFGLSAYGGPANAGTFFEIAAGAHSATVLNSFTGDNGDSPLNTAGLTSDAKGNLYGTTYYGGVGYSGTIDTGFGTIFKIAAGSNSITNLVKFNGTNGTDPVGKILFDSSGNIYGTTLSGGTNNDGTLYELTAATNTLKTLVNFTNTDANPGGGVIADSQGNLYGVTGTIFGGQGFPGGYGTIYEFNIKTRQLSTLFTFNGADGGGPTGDLYMNASGDLVGTASFNGAQGAGNIFEFDPVTNAFTILHSFLNGPGTTDGIFPPTGLIADAQGNLYGTAGHGGLYGEGTVFELAIVTEPCSLAIVALLGMSWMMRRRV